MPQTLSRVNPKNSKVVATYVRKTKREKKRKKLFIRASMYLARKYKFGTLFLRLLLETEPPFYVAIRARRRSSRLHGVDSIFISQIFKALSIGPAVPAIELCSQALYQLSKSWNINRLRHLQARHGHVTLLIVLNYCFLFLIQVYRHLTTGFPPRRGKTGRH